MKLEIRPMGTPGNYYFQVFKPQRRPSFLIEYLPVRKQWVAWSAHSRRIDRFEHFQEAFEFAGKILEDF